LNAYLPKHVAIRRVPSAGRDAVFEFFPDGDFAELVRTTILFKTNHPDCPTIQVRLTLKLAGSIS
jgi:hypothetical protein